MRIDGKSLQKTLDDLKRVVGDQKKHSQHQYDFHSFQLVKEPFRLAVIDGSNHNIRGTNFTLTTLRSGYQIFKGEDVVEEEIDSIKMEFLSNNDDPYVGFESKFEAYYNQIVKEMPVKYPEFDKTPDRLRTLLEWDKLVQLIDKMGKDDIIMFDGTLISGTITTNHDFFHDLVDKAKEKGITLIGLSKDTSLSIESASVPQVLSQSAMRQHGNKNWYVEYKPGVYFVRFTKLVDYVFRMDAVIPDHLNVEKILGRLLSYCYDEAVLGYPHPMQSIHDSVRIEEMEKEQCYAALREEFLKRGYSEREFEDLFAIYHDQLDIISYGR